MLYESFSTKSKPKKQASFSCEYLNDFHSSKEFSLKSVTCNVISSSSLKLFIGYSDISGGLVFRIGISGISDISGGLVLYLIFLMIL